MTITCTPLNSRHVESLKLTKELNPFPEYDIVWAHSPAISDNL